MTMPTKKTTASKLTPMQQQMLDILSDHQWHGSRELALKVTHNARDVIRALKHMGYQIEDEMVSIPDVRDPNREKMKKAKHWRLVK